MDKLTADNATRTFSLDDASYAILIQPERLILTRRWGANETFGLLLALTLAAVTLRIIFRVADQLDITGTFYMGGMLLFLCAVAASYCSIALGLRSIEFSSDGVRIAGLIPRIISSDSIREFRVRAIEHHMLFPASCLLWELHTLKGKRHLLLEGCSVKDRSLIEELNRNATALLSQKR